ncbi:MAG: efflux RND transporter periplasmic adaptor subunit [Bacteroidota bacterium]
MKISKKTWIKIGIGAVVIIIIVLAIGKKQGWIGKNTEIKISVEKVSTRSIIETVTANGKIQPEIEVKVSPDISGELTELFVKEGDRVKAGQVLAKVDPEMYISNYDQSVAMLNTQMANEANSKARLVQAQAQFNNAQLTFNRNEKLWKSKTISDAEYDAAKASYESAKAEVSSSEQTVRASNFTVKNSEAALKQSKENLTKTTIYAPTDGTISKLNVERGERVSGTSQFSSGTELMRIANLAGMEVKVSVNENDIVRVKLGDTALIEVDAYLNRKFKGIVSEIATSANVSGVSVDQVTNFDVKIRVLADSYKDLLRSNDTSFTPLRPGMSATVDIQTHRVANVLTVPIQAVTTRIDSTALKAEKDKEKSVAQSTGDSDQNKTAKNQKENQEQLEYVFVYQDGIVKMVKVKTGIQDNTFIQILEGIKVGDDIVTAPYRAISKTLKDGDKVKMVDKKELFNQD